MLSISAVLRNILWFLQNMFKTRINCALHLKSSSVYVFKVCNTATATGLVNILVRYFDTLAIESAFLVYFL